VVLFSLKRLTAVAVLGSLSCLAAYGQAKQPQWKDRAEYDLYDSIIKEKNNDTKLGLLRSWEQKYPTSEYKEQRAQLIVQTYQAMNKGKEMMEAAKEMLADYPKSFFALYWINLLTLSLNDTSPAALDTGEKAAKAFLAIMDETFDPSKKAATVTDEAWKKERTTMEAVAYKTLGWVAMQRNQNEEAEKYLLEVLKRNPHDAASAFWAGTVILKQRNIAKYSIGLYYFAVAAAHEGEGALPEAQRKQTLAYVEKSYVNYHGSKDGLDEMMAKAKAEPAPPADFKIESKDEILAKQEEELKKTNPMLALWVNMKRALTAPNGKDYFETTVKNANIPGGVEVGGTKVEKFKATVVSATPAARPKEVVVGISSPDMSEVTLRFEKPQTKIDPGTEIEFSGAPVEFTQDPFNLVFTVDPKDVIGWPKPAPPPARPAGKKAAPKK
jgi:tetratricopeptide (TPR) repeat protein